MGWRLRGWGAAAGAEAVEATTVFREAIRAVVEVVPGGVIRAGKTGYADEAHAGFWLGVDADGTPRLHVGGGAYYLKWTGARLELAGGLRTKNAYVQVVDESDEDYGEGITLLQGAWLESGALRWRDAGGDVGAFVTANNNGSGGTAALIHAYPRATGAGNTAAIALTAHDRAYGESGGRAWGFTLNSAGEASTAAGLRAGGGADQVQLRVDACEDGQTADLIAARDAAGDTVARVDATGRVEAVAYCVGGVQVVGTRQAAIANLSATGSAEDGAARAQINAILAALRAHGLIGG